MPIRLTKGNYVTSGKGQEHSIFQELKCYHERNVTLSMEMFFLCAVSQGERGFCTKK